ncbi:MAG: dimethylargininase [Gemmatimonas sp. SG8_28]|nr:MAG: dimethylargininase [Gemmatimonas sp. SG8_28]
MIVALTRPPTSALAQCELTHLERAPIDIGLAQSQHRAYEDLLAMLGARVIALPEEPELPDAIFVEDTAVVLDEIAVLARPGAASRLAEVDTIESVLTTYRPLHRIEAPGTLDGGDVLRVQRALYVGRSTRTNEAGITQLAQLVEPLGYRVRAVPVAGCLHLKSACSHIGDSVVLVNGNWIDTGAFTEVELLEIDAAEPAAANAVLVEDAILMASDVPRTADLVRNRGRRVVTVDLSELRKAEAGGTCMSLIFEERSEG